MPMFDTEYEVEIDKDHMAWEAKFDTGDRVLISPHLCNQHEHQPDDDHRGWVDMTFLKMTPFGFFLPPQHATLDLEHASAFIEGLTMVGEWAHLNRQLGEDGI